MADAPTPIVIRRVKKVVGGGHHGGSWKVAFADFATAMMAFFLLMWLIAATTKEQKGAISEYFNNPSMMDGRATAPSPGMNGPGGASTSLVKLGSGMELKKVTTKPSDPKEIKRLSKELERKRLETLMKELRQAIEASQALEPFKDQLLIDITPAGLRIQIVDKQNRPMFDIGSSQLKPYTIEILHELGAFIQTVPNRISISGHTDNAPYGDRAGYTNWELSADRANAARRALIGGGLDEGKVAVVVGLASSVLFDKTSPEAPINRRISIVVMSQAEEASVGADGKSDNAIEQALPNGVVTTADAAAAVPVSAPEPAAPPAGSH